MEMRCTKRLEFMLLANLGPFLAFVARRYGYPLLVEEVQAIEVGIGQADAEADQWYAYQFAGCEPVGMWLATDFGSSIFYCKIECEDSLSVTVEVAAEIMGLYQLVR